MEKKEKTQSSKKKKNAFLFSLSSVFSLFASTYTLQFDLSLLFCPEVVTVKEEEVLFVVVLSPSKVNINQSTCREEGGGVFFVFFSLWKRRRKKKTGSFLFDLSKERHVGEGPGGHSPTSRSSYCLV